MTYPIDFNLFTPRGDYLVPAVEYPDMKITAKDFFVVHSTTEVSGVVVGVVRDLARGTK